MTEPPPPEPFAPEGAVDWALGKVFTEALLKPLVYALLPDRVDPRDWMQAKRLEVRLEPHEAPAGAKDHWFDFIADTGDSDVGSYSVAYLFHGDLTVLDPEGRLQLDEPTLQGSPDVLPSAERDAGTLLPRGGFLFVGGDTAYPVADFAQIKARFTRPLNHAYARRFASEPPPPPRPLLGIPGNHDWYDNLDGFNRAFREPSPPAPQHTGVRLAAPLGHFTLQPASYFTLGLPGGWDFWALDARDDTDVDHRQWAFFDAQAAHLAGGSPRVLLATPTPPFVYGAKEPWADSLFARLPAPTRAGTRLWFSGDSHHYARYERAQLEPGASITSLVAGLGGAVLHAPVEGGLAPAAVHPSVSSAEAAVKRALGARLVTHPGMRRLGAVVGAALGACALQHTGEVAPWIDRLWRDGSAQPLLFPWVLATTLLAGFWLAVKLRRSPGEADARRRPASRRLLSIGLPPLLALSLLVLISQSDRRTFGNVVLDLGFELATLTLFAGVSLFLIAGLRRPRSIPGMVALLLATSALTLSCLGLSIATARGAARGLAGLGSGVSDFADLLLGVRVLLATLSTGLALCVAFPIGAGLVLRLAFGLGSQRSLVSSFACVDQYQAFIRFRLRVRDSGSTLTGFVIAVDKPVSRAQLRDPKAAASDVTPSAKLVDVFSV
ncbi:MAG TPA: hypothetical protein VNN80_33475, partial [Polyangiaceae bacterium]|nr:hypothetical protein [Polyangiaceae bacterium]